MSDKQEVSDHSEDLAVKGMMVLEWNLNKYGVNFWAAVSRQPRIGLLYRLLLGALAHLRTATISFMPDPPSVRLHGTTRLPLDGFS